MGTSKNLIHRGARMTNQQQPLPPKKIALVIDGEVVDVLHTDDRLAAIFLSEPVIVDVTNNTSVPDDFNIVGMLYNKNENIFSPKE